MKGRDKLINAKLLDELNERLEMEATDWSCFFFISLFREGRRTILKREAENGKEQMQRERNKSKLLYWQCRKRRIQRRIFASRPR